VLSLHLDLAKVFTTTPVPERQAEVEFGIAASWPRVHLPHDLIGGRRSQVGEAHGRQQKHKREERWLR
jgi:hypothetical protein